MLGSPQLGKSKFGVAATKRLGTAALDQEIVRSFKTIYQKLFLQRLLTNIKEITNIKDIVRKVSILDYLHLIQKSWAEVSKETTVICFHRTGVSNSLDYLIETNMKDKD